MYIPEGHPSGVDVRAFMQEMEPRIRVKLEEEILALSGVKFQLALKVQLRKDNPDVSKEYTDPVLRHKQEAFLQASEINENLNRAITYLLELLEKWLQRGSEWVVDRVQTLWMDVARYQPLRGGSPLPLPAAVRNKKVVINPKHMDDNNCLEWTFLIAEADRQPQPQHHPERISWYAAKKVKIALLKVTPQCPALRFQNSKNCLMKPSTYLVGTRASLPNA